MKNTKTIILSSVAVFTLTVGAHATVVSHSFGGNFADNIDGVTPDVNGFISSTWSATGEDDPDFHLRADGSAVDATGGVENVDRGAFLDLGAGFFAANTTYTLNIDFGALNDAAIFVGFTNAATPSLVSTAQVEGSANLAIRARDFGSNDAVAIWNRVGTTNNVTSVDSGTNTFDGSSFLASMEIVTNSLTDADVTVTFGALSNSITGVDISGMQYLYYGVEDAIQNSAQGNLAKINSVQLIPEPSSALLSLAAALFFLRRRR